MNLAVLGTLTAAGGKTSAALFSEMRCPGQGRRIGRIRRVQTAARRFGVLGIHAALVGPIAQKPMKCLRDVLGLNFPHQQLARKPSTIRVIHFAESTSDGRSAIRYAIWPSSSGDRVFAFGWLLSSTA